MCARDGCMSTAAGLNGEESLMLNGVWAAQVELLPGGRDRAVTNGNRLEYIHRVANFRLNVQIKRATDAFRSGLEDVIARDWITMFNEAELQVTFRCPAVHCCSFSSSARMAPLALVLVYYGFSASLTPPLSWCRDAAQSCKCPTSSSLAF